MNDERKQKIQDKIKELEEIVSYFEQEVIDLDKAISKYEQADKLVKDVSKVLREYETRIERISSNQSED